MFDPYGDKWKNVEIPDELRLHANGSTIYSTNSAARQIAFEAGYQDGLAGCGPKATASHPINVIAYDHGWCLGTLDRDAMEKVRNEIWHL